MDGEFDSPPSPPSLPKPYLLQEGPLRFPEPPSLVLARKRHPSEPIRHPVFRPGWHRRQKHCSQAPVPPGNRCRSPESPKIVQDIPGLNRILELRHVSAGQKSLRFFLDFMETLPGKLPFQVGIPGSTHPTFYVLTPFKDRSGVAPVHLVLDYPIDPIFPQFQIAEELPARDCPIPD